MTLSPVFKDLSPALVWAHFATLCAIPRPSKGEARLREHLLAWAEARGLPASVDAAGNLIVRKPASAGREALPGVILQSHLDMVCQSNADTPHDFLRDPISPLVRDGWLLAEGTTLGADNGIGVALMLAVLEDKSLLHGPLEALFTVDEESGMGGARGLDPLALRGTLMLNLDTEEWGEFYLGCAGGVDVSVSRPGRAEAVPEGQLGFRIDVRGLRGGHSGVNIHEGRGHAIKILVRVLRQLERRWEVRLSTLQGGTARNALPREAFATLALPAAAAATDALGHVLADLQATLRSELAAVDEGLTISCVPCAIERVMAASEQALWLASLHAAPQAVRRMSVRVPGVVETSDNLGVIDLSPESGSCHFMVRSLVDSAGIELADEIVSLFALSATPAELSGHYPGWTPNPASPLLALCQSVYRETFGAESTTQVIHAGLDTSAVALAAALKADECQIYTDVDGVYTTDPRVEPEARKLDTITFEEMMEMASLGSKVLQIRSVEFAGKYKVKLRVLSSFEDEGEGTLITVEEDKKMEHPIISGIAFNRDEAKLTVLGAPDLPGIAYKILGPIADANIDVDMIIQNVGHDGTTDFSFTVNRGDYNKALGLLKEVADKMGARGVVGDNKTCKVSAVGVGMRSHPGVASKMFNALGAEGINIQMISTSEIKISVVLEEKYLELAVRVLHKAFGLDKGE